ncbi:MAG: hypothetical protein ACREA4_10320 [Nitrososphaera sp.]
MQSATDGGKLAPACGGCGSSQGVAPSMHSYRGSYFCIRCCNYLDDTGKVRG